MPIYMPKGAPKGGTKFAWALPGFDQKAFEASEPGQNMAKMKKIYDKYPHDEMNPAVIKYWEKNGLKKELYDADINDGKNKYSVFTPLDMDNTKRYALVYNSHGGLAPINICETTGFPMLAGKEKFICVCPENGGPSNDDVETEFPRIVNALVKKGYPIDMGRIYAVGYSAGSDATGVVACAWPEMVAAISPDPGGNLFAKGKWYENESYYEKNKKYSIPMICVGGTMDGGDRYPFQHEEGYKNFNIWMETIVKAANYKPITLEESRKLAKETDNEAKKFFGVNFDRTFNLHMEGIDWYCGDFLNEKGIAAARFITGAGLPHAQTKYHVPIVWDFLKHFSRDTITGESIYTPVVVDGIR